MGHYQVKNERHFDGDDKNYVILAPLIDCHVPGRTVSGELNKIK